MAKDKSTEKLKVAKKTEAAQALSGVFGAYDATAAHILRDGTRFVYNGTTLDLVFRGALAGAQPGDRILTPGIGRHTVTWEITPTGGGDRTPGGIWARRATG